MRHSAGLNEYSLDRRGNYRSGVWFLSEIKEFHLNSSLGLVRGGHRPSAFSNGSKAKSEKRQRILTVEELAERFEAGLDLKTGDPLAGEDVYDHSRIQEGKRESEMNRHWNEMLENSPEMN